MVAHFWSVLLNYLFKHTKKIKFGYGWLLDLQHFKNKSPSTFSCGLWNCCFHMRGEVVFVVSHQVALLTPSGIRVSLLAAWYPQRPEMDHSQRVTSSRLVALLWRRIQTQWSLKFLSSYEETALVRKNNETWGDGLFGRPAETTNTETKSV